MPPKKTSTRIKKIDEKIYKYLNKIIVLKEEKHRLLLARALEDSLKVKKGRGRPSKPLNPDIVSEIEELKAQYRIKSDTAAMWAEIEEIAKRKNSSISKARNNKELKGNIKTFTNNLSKLRNPKK